MNEYFQRYFANLASIATAALVLLAAWWIYEERERAKEERLLLEKRYAKLLEIREDGHPVDDSKAYQLATAYKEQVELAKQLATAWKEVAKERGERIKLTGETIVSVDKSKETQKGNDYEFLTEQGKKGFSLNEIRVAGTDSPPIGYVLVKKDGEVQKGTYAFEIHVESVQLKDDLTGKIRVVSRAFLVPKQNGLAGKRRPDLKQWKDEPYQLPVTGGNVLIDPQEPIVPIIKEKGLVWWPMNLNVGLGVFSVNGITESRTMADVTLLGYGLSKQNLDWKFLNIGINHSNDYGIGMHLSPLTWRPAPDTLTNTYLGPGYWSDAENQGYFMGVQVGL